jgi:abhydrolase domain-containing protein 13
MSNAEGVFDMFSRWVPRLLQGASILAVASLGALYFLQEKILYIPKIPGVPNAYICSPGKYGLEYDDVWLEAADGTKLHCWHVKARSMNSSPPPVVLFFQENAGNMSFRMPFIALLVHRLHVSVFVLGYRGYGESHGSPTQEGLQMDADAALNHVLERSDVDTSKIVVYGKSLGGAVALYVAAKHESKLRGAIVENTFLSVEEMVPHVIPALGFAIGEKKPLNWLVRNKWRNRERIKDVTKLPLLLIGSTQVRLPYSICRKISVDAA